MSESKPSSKKRRAARMVKVYTPVIVDSHVEMQEHFLGKYVLVKDFDRAISLQEELVEALKRALSTVRTHAMQTYSNVSRSEAADIEKLLAKVKWETEQFLEECK